MKKIALYLLLGGMVATSVVGVQSCIKKDHDVPEDQTGYDPNLKVTHTIAQVLNMSNAYLDTANVVVSGIVVMDDRSGNYYKSFVIQDSTAGVEINLDQNNIYNDYPVGRKVYVKCKGLKLATYGGMKSLSYEIDANQSAVGIPFTQASEFIVKANYPNNIELDTFTYSQLANVANNDAILNKLIVVKDIEFDESVLGSTYAVPTSTTNRLLHGCGVTNSTIVLRTSNYAKFQGIKVPGGKGNMVALYTKYNSTPQLFIRDTSDIKFGTTRCDGSSSNVNFLMNEAFTNLNDWTAVSVSGAQVWNTANYGNPAPSAVMTGYASSTNNANEDWLISKSLNFSGFNKFTLTFETAAKYGGNNLLVYVSTNYTSGDPSTATWTPLTCTLADVNGNFVWTKSGNVDLSAYKNQTNVRIAFKYTSTTSAAPTWEVDNIKIKAE